MKNVLLVLTDNDLVAKLTSALRGAGYGTRSVRMPDDFAGTRASFSADLAILDEQLPSDDIQAWSLVMTALSPGTRIIDISRSADADRRLVVSAHGYLREPFSMEAMLAEVRRVLAAPASALPALA